MYKVLHAKIHENKIFGKKSCSGSYILTKEDKGSVLYKLTIILIMRSLSLYLITYTDFKKKRPHLKVNVNIS